MGVEHRLTPLPSIGRGCVNIQIPEKTNPQRLLGILDTDTRNNPFGQTYLSVSSWACIISKF